MAIVRNHHKLYDTKQQKFIILHFQKSEIWILGRKTKVLAELCSFCRSSKRIYFLVFHVSRGYLAHGSSTILKVHPPNLYFHCFISFSNSDPPYKDHGVYIGFVWII